MGTKYQPADWPLPIPTTVLNGSLVTLEPLLSSHLDDLIKAGSDPATWEFTTSRADSPSLMRSYLDELLGDCANGMAIAYAVRQASSNAIVGCTRLKNINRNHRNGIVGSWYSPAAWRTGANLEAKLLLLGYAFEYLGCVRIEFHTDARNTRSRHSLDQLGAVFEGILRSHQITRTGTLRDSAIYSLLDHEWPAARAAIMARLQRHSNPVASPTRAAP